MPVLLEPKGWRKPHRSEQSSGDELLNDERSRGDVGGGHAILSERRRDGDGRGTAGSSRRSGILLRCTTAAATCEERQRKNQDQKG